MGHAGLAGIKHHLVLVVDGSWGWARLLAVNQTQKSNNLAQILHVNQTSALVHSRPGRGWLAGQALHSPDIKHALFVSPCWIANGRPLVPPSGLAGADSMQLVFRFKTRRFKAG